jgi:hypothetical protein
MWVAISAAPRGSAGYAVFHTIRDMMSGILRIQLESRLHNVAEA